MLHLGAIKTPLDAVQAAIGALIGATCSIGAVLEP
jgi:hypothetical protein